MIMMSFCWKRNVLPNKIKSNSVSSTMFMKLAIKVVAFFLGHPVFQPFSGFKLQSAWYIYHQYSSLFLLMVWRYIYKRQYTDKTLTLKKIYMRASGASELRNYFAFLHSKTAIFFNILLVLQILCRYKWHACRLTSCVPTKLHMEN